MSLFSTLILGSQYDLPQRTRLPRVMTVTRYEMGKVKGEMLGQKAEKLSKTNEVLSKLYRSQRLLGQRWDIFIIESKMAVID